MQRLFAVVAFVAATTIYLLLLAAPAWGALLAVRLVISFSGLSDVALVVMTVCAAVAACAAGIGIALAAVRGADRLLDAVGAPRLS